MSVLIKGANIPVMGCLYCQLRNGDNCVASDILDVSKQLYKSTKERHPDCPLVEVPTLHGRLIDADRLKSMMEKYHCNGCDNYNGARCSACWVDDCFSYIDDIPAIIEAEVSK